MSPRASITTRLSLFALCLALTAPLASGAEQPLRIGVTLHAYYSWVQNLGSATTIVVPVRSSDSDPHLYQPLPEDIARLKTLDALVINGIGHDEFIRPMLQAVGDEAPTLIEPNAGVPLIQGGAMEPAKAATDSHTFLSITGALHQIGNLAAALERLDPDNAAHYRNQARVYKRRLRGLLAGAMKELKALRTTHLRVGTVHSGYSYLFQELGLRVHAIVQPRHGIAPSARQLADSIQRIEQAEINILFTEADYEQRFVDVLLEETGTRVARLSHISRGPYRAEHYEEQMAANLRQILDAIKAMQ